MRGWRRAAAGLMLKRKPLKKKWWNGCWFGWKTPEFSPRGSNSGDPNWKETLRLDVRVQHFLDFRFSHCAHPLLDHLATLEKQQRGNPANVVAHGRLAVIIDVQFSDFGLPIVLGCNRIDGWTHLPARTAPFGPKIYQHRLR